MGNSSTYYCCNQYINQNKATCAKSNTINSIVETEIIKNE